MNSPISTPAPLNRPMSLSFPPDQPFVPDGLEKTDGLTGEQRRDAQQHLSKVRQHNAEMQGMEIAIRDYRINLAMQSVWLTGGCYMIRRGFIYCDYTQSFATSFTKNTFVCRLMNPASMVGLLVAGVTAAQLPTDIKALMSAHDWYNKALVSRDAEAAQFQQKMKTVNVGAAVEGLRKASDGFDEAAKN